MQKIGALLLRQKSNFSDTMPWQHMYLRICDEATVWVGRRQSQGDIHLHLSKKSHRCVYVRIHTSRACTCGLPFKVFVEQCVS